MTRTEFLNMTGDFTWFFGQFFFIETSIGNFIWSDPDYNGDNSIVPFEGTVKDYSELCGHFGRCKGIHTIGGYCGDQVNITINLEKEI